MDELKSIIARVKDADPTFGQPWEADAFVTAVSLSEMGFYDWKVWVETFAEVIKNQPQKADETAHDAYYRQWLYCLELVLDNNDLLHKSEILIREEMWRSAYQNTPHGAPVVLSAASEHDDDNHVHHHHHDECGVHAHHHTEIKPFRVFSASKLKTPHSESI